MLNKIENIPFVQWLTSNEQVLVWLAIISVVFFVLSLILIPWLIIRIPPNYFSEPGRFRSALLGEHPLAIIVTKIIRNTIAVCFIVLGILLLILPGQGLLTILLGVFIADFPGKHKLVNWIVARKGVMKTINWLRKKSGKEPIVLED
ncbi:MAG: hypothetical protein ACRBCS_14410 [Cellvibrionaceae bacterium]